MYSKTVHFIITYKEHTLILYTKLIHRIKNSFSLHDYFVITGGNLDGNEYSTYDELSFAITLPNNPDYNYMWNFVYEMFINKEKYMEFGDTEVNIRL